jgi:hypothetical protein
VILYRFLVNTFGPTDRSGNGIAVGDAKAFDNRSLTLMLEQLNASLQAFNVVSQNVVENLGLVQGESSTETERAARIGWKWGLSSGPATAVSKEPQNGTKAARPADDRAEAGKTAAAGSGGGADQTATESAGTKRPSDQAGKARALGISAGDALTEQLNLAYQIFNLRILNERALSDRLYHSDNEPQPQPRLQVVLGLQVSINPPDGMQDCAAIVEVGLKTHGSEEPVSVVALIPQEKTYNSATLSTKAKSVDGSVVSTVVTVGGSRSRQTKDLYLHRDADTVAFERVPGWKAGAFWPRKDNTKPSLPTVFGWEFRPVLGRRTVSPGTRQMLAVVALPFVDEVKRASLTVQARTYWRAYNRKRQTTAPRWGWWPLNYPHTRQIESETQELKILPTGEVQTALKPVVENVYWVDAGDGSAVVVVEGRNFFSGTEVIIGGRSHRGPDTGLVLKSDRAFEVRTTVAALAMGDVLLSGRFGPAMPLTMPSAKLPVPAIVIVRPTLYLASGGFRELRLTLCAAGAPGRRLRFQHLRSLPNPVIYVNGRPVPTPYDYSDGVSNPEQTEPDAVNVAAWIPADFFVGGNPVVLFKVPFCGPDWVARSVITADAPKIERLGGDQQQTITITSPGFDFGNDWILTLDKDYLLGSAEFMALDRRLLQLTVPANVMRSYKKLVLRSPVYDSGYLLEIPPPSESPLTTVILDDRKGSPIVAKGKPAVVNWQGTALDTVTKVRAGAEELPFESYSRGQGLRVFLRAAQTASEGKLDVELMTKTGAKLPAAVFVLDEMLAEKNAAEAAGA